MRRKDKYDKHIEAILLAKYPQDQIHEDWEGARGLFKFLAADCACPTIEKIPGGSNLDPVVLRAIRKSKLIPSRESAIRPQRRILNAFARIQRLADKVYNRL